MPGKLKFLEDLQLLILKFRIGELLHLSEVVVGHRLLRLYLLDLFEMEMRTLEVHHRILHQLGKTKVHMVDLRVELLVRWGWEEEGIMVVDQV